MAKFVTDASGATWWPLEPMQVAFFLLVGEIIQVKEAIPWVRCASGNVSSKWPVPGISDYILIKSGKIHWTKNGFWSICLINVVCNEHYR